MNKLGEKIKEIRKQKRFTQKKLAESLGVTQQTVLRWEKGEREPKWDMIQNIIKVLGTPQLIEDVNQIGEYDQMNSLGLGYWGNVVDNAKKVAKNGDIEEKILIKALLKSAYEAFNSCSDNKFDNSINTNIKINNEGDNNYNGNVID